MFYQIILFCLLSFSLFSTDHVYLKTPVLSKQDIIGTTVGIRPYRKSGIRIEPEIIQNKLIIHNYGYGGSGLTLAFGGSKEVQEVLNTYENHSHVVAVLGAGVVGLTTAYDLLEKGYEVHIYSADWSPNLTSDVAAGSWTPLMMSGITNEKQILHKRMLDYSETRFLKSISPYCEFNGVNQMNVYVLRNSNEALLPNQENEDIVVHFDNGVVKKGRQLKRIGLDGKIFMKDLFDKVKAKGAHLHQVRFQNLKEIVELEESVIINCMSLGSKEIFNDQELYPVRGQIIHLKQQSDHNYMLVQAIANSKYFFHLYPWSDLIILGGVVEEGQDLCENDQVVLDKIFENAEKCLNGDI